MYRSYLIKVLFLTVTIIELSESVDIHHTAGDFCYGDDVCDPSSDKWGGICKTGNKQSPINIPATYLLKYDPKHSLFIEMNEDYTKQHHHFYLKNNGHTIQVQLDRRPRSKAVAYLTGIHLRQKPYIFAQLHFHWGSDDTDGSEHELDGKNTAMEIHLVHYSEDYDSLEEAIKSNDTSALAVIAVFVKTSKEAKRISSLSSIIDHIPKKYMPEPTEIRKQMNLGLFFPSVNRDKLFMYEGSLTTPPCLEFVVWAVLLQPIYIHPSDIQKFRTIEDDEGFILNQNSRPVQNRTNLDLPDKEVIDEDVEEDYVDNNEEPEPAPKVFDNSEPEAEPEDELKYS